MISRGPVLLLFAVALMSAAVAAALMLMQVLHCSVHPDAQGKAKWQLEF
jgi:hypothetical protein